MPYKYKKEKGKYVVYKKSGEKVGTTGGTKDELNKYLAALHIHEPKKKMKKEAIEGSIDSVYAVQKPYVGCQLTSLVQPIDPLVGLGGSEIVPEKVHAVYADQEMAQSIAQQLYEEFQAQQEALEEKKIKVIEKIKSTMNVLEKQRKESVRMIQENPKEAQSHKEKVAQIATKMDHLVNQLQRIEMSKKDIENDEEKNKKEKKKVEEALINFLSEAHYRDQIYKKGDTFTITNVDNLPKGHKDLKVGDKVTVIGIRKNLNGYLYDIDKSEKNDEGKPKYGLDNEDIENLTKKK